MKYHRPTKAARVYMPLLACLAVALLSSGPVRAQILSPFRITSFVLSQDGSAALQWQGANTDIVVQFTADVTAPAWQPLPGVEWPVSGTNWSGVIPTSPGKGFLRVVTTGGVGTAPIPLKTISLTLIGWHDPQSDKFYRNCIACHGTRTQERALDGTTPTAHSLMLAFYGQGNDRCLTCHYNGPNRTGPDFLTYSAGSLRQQVNYEVNGCTACHAKGSIQPLYDRY
ncbi:MAG: hypothetical protein HY674_12955 [Chloroflexi bacterium]|nr:hypothetical protein [Chloroflexota bacterium]